ncbi:MAG: hypothetical protein ABI882_21935 [Acidobacteriota bacterium]
MTYPLRVRLHALYFILVALTLPVGAAQQRDHLTEEEADLVREMQIIDQRIDIFIGAADRRLLVLTNPNPTQKKKEEERWGPLPTGTKLELLTDLKKILSEAMEKIDDAVARNRNDPLVAKALDKLKKAATRQLVEMRALAGKVTDKREERALAEAIEEADVASKGSLQ